MTKDELLLRLRDIEWDDFEVKAAQSELPKNIWETVSAFCNSSGGWIVLGVMIQNTFIRCGSGDQRATHSEISAMFREQSFGIRSELSIQDTHIELLNQDSLRSYRNYLNAYNSLASYPDYDHEAFCRKLSITDEKGWLTYAGLLMLGRREVIHRHVPTFWMDYLEIPGVSVQEARTRYTYRIPEQENLWEYYHVIIKRLRLLVDMPFRMNGEGFAVDDDSQLNVLREALVNMLMHTDHFSSIHSCIRVFTNRVEFMNAGGFHIPIERLSTSMISKPRNPSIAKLFRFAKLCENVGFGIDKLKSWKQLTGYNVDIHSEIDYANVTFDIKNTLFDENGQSIQLNDSVSNDNSIERDGVKDGVRDGVKDGVRDGVNPVQKRLLEIITQNPQISAKSLSEILNINIRNTEKNIKILKSRELLQRVGSDKTGYWIVLNKNSC